MEAFKSSRQAEAASLGIGGFLSPVRKDGGGQPRIPPRLWSFTSAKKFLPGQVEPGSVRGAALCVGESGGSEKESRRSSGCQLFFYPCVAQSGVTTPRITNSSYQKIALPPSSPATRRGSRGRHHGFGKLARVWVSPDANAPVRNSFRREKVLMGSSEKLCAWSAPREARESF
jgi:hypothetical protein